MKEKILKCVAIENSIGGLAHLKVIELYSNWTTYVVGQKYLAIIGYPVKMGDVFIRYEGAIYKKVTDEKEWYWEK